MRFFLFVALLLAGCSHSIHIVNTSGFSPYGEYGGGKIVKGYTERFIVMGFSFDTDYVEDAYHNLMRQCPNGTIKGITTQYSTSHGFFSWTEKVLMQGLCAQ